MKYDIDNIYRYHAPVPELNQQQRYERIRELARHLADFIISGDYSDQLVGCPESRERSLALTRLEESVMWANASIARNEKPKIDNDDGA